MSTMMLCRHGHSLADAYVNKRGIRECRVCRAAARARHYAEHKAEYVARAYAQRASRRRFLTAVKTTLGCADCGTTEGRLDFDHRPGTTKLFNLAHPHAAGWAGLLAELEKCEVRCASCHTRSHHRRV